MTAARRPTFKTVLLIGSALLGLWALSFALSYVSLGRAALPVALGIAALKAALVALFFMELLYESASIKLTMVLAATLTLLLGGLMVADIATREFTPPRLAPRELPGAAEPRSP